MEKQNSYLVYKRDTNYLVYWIINASNAIIEASHEYNDSNFEESNVTGKLTVAALVAVGTSHAKCRNPGGRKGRNRPNSFCE